MNKAVVDICRQFTSAVIVEIVTLGNGLINDTYLVTTEHDSFVLQRINTQVFPNPVQIMENLNCLHQHLQQNSTANSQLKIPQVINTIQGENCYFDDQSEAWRALEFIDNTESKEVISNHQEAQQVGFALGVFHCLLSDAKAADFHDTLPGFHIAPQYYAEYQSAENQQGASFNSEQVQFCRQFINEFKAKIKVLEHAKEQGLLAERLIHGDPKLNNFLFDKQSGKIISLIDLDTVKPGLAHYDIADCLRSCCHIPESDTFDSARSEIILKSYLSQVSSFFSEQDYQFLFPAIELIPFELGLRFFTDFLLGNQYFKVDFEEQNLNRAVAQFKLCKSIAEQELKIKSSLSPYLHEQI